MDILLENWLSFDLFEFSFEVFETGSIGTAVGATTSISQIEAFILDFLSIYTPVFDMLADGNDVREVQTMLKGETLMEVKTYHPPFPAPFFLVFLGSTSV